MLLVATLQMTNKRERLIKQFNKQRGICPWCGLIMILAKRTLAVSATIDHLEPKLLNGCQKNPERRFVVAHRLCNSARGHAPSITDKARTQIKKYVNQYFFNKIKLKT